MCVSERKEVASAMTSQEASCCKIYTLYVAVGAIPRTRAGGIGSSSPFCRRDFFFFPLGASARSGSPLAPMSKSFHTGLRILDGQHRVWMARSACSCMARDRSRLRQSWPIFVSSETCSTLCGAAMQRCCERQNHLCVRFCMSQTTASQGRALLAFGCNGPLLGSIAPVPLPPAACRASVQQHSVAICSVANPLTLSVGLPSYPGG